MDKYEALVSAMEAQDQEIKYLRSELLELINYVAKQKNTMLFAFDKGTIQMTLVMSSDRYSVARIDFSPIEFTKEHAEIFKIIFGEIPYDNLRNIIADQDKRAYKYLQMFSTVIHKLYGYASTEEKIRLQELFDLVVQDSFGQIYLLSHGTYSDGPQLIMQLKTVLDDVPSDILMFVEYIEKISDLNSQAEAKKILVTRIVQLFPEGAVKLFI